MNCPPASTNAAFPAAGPGTRSGEVMPNAVRTLTDAEAAYIAGIVDGEGTVSLVCHHRGEHRRPVVSVANTIFGR